MIYTPLTRKALRIAYAAHHGQVEWDGVPYIFHPLHLAEQMKDETATAVALLHDVVEDTKLTLSDLRAEGFPERVLESVSLLTHDRAVPYADYVARLVKDPVARAVKLADLRHNMDVTRLEHIGPREAERLERYRAARVFLESFGPDR